MIEKIQYDNKKYNFAKVFQEYFEEDLTKFLYHTCPQIPSEDLEPVGHLIMLSS